MSEIIKGFKIRIYPTKEQEKLIWQHIGSCRYIWNYMLDLQIERHKNGEPYLSGYDMVNLLTSLKKDGEHNWLKDVSNDSLAKMCLTLAKDYNSFFKKRTGSPRFKSRKRSKLSFPVRCDRFYFDGETVQIQKIGRVKYKSDFSFPYGNKQKFTNVHVSIVNGKYMLSFGMECENQAPRLTDSKVGIDLGIKDLAVVACDDNQLVFHNINKSKRVRDLNCKLKHTQRSIARKYEASKRRTGVYEKTKNIEREEDKLRKICARLTNIRHNYLHQTTNTIVSMLPQRVTMENLNVRGMMKNKHLSRAIAEQGFYEFIRQMKYKCEWNGIEFVQADRFFPSSKTCSCCGAIKRDLKLKDRTFVCPECGFIIDRDYNAAINLMRYADLQTQAAV